MRFVMVFLTLFWVGGSRLSAAEEVNLSGIWVGTYELTIENGDVRQVGLSMILDHKGMAVMGRMVEEYTIGRIGESARTALIAGTLDDANVFRFEKRYLADDLGAALVQYEMKLHANRQVIEGTWAMGEQRSGHCVMAKMSRVDRSQFILKKMRDD